MRRQITIAAALLAALTLSAQTPPDLQTLSTTVRGLRRNTTAGDDVKAKVDKLIADAQTEGQSGEARRRLANAYSLLNGLTWDQKQ
jgi:hypothetical protein